MLFCHTLCQQAGLKSFQFGKRQFAVMYMHGAKLGTAVQRRHGLARVQQSLGIEGGFYRVELLQFWRIKLHAHLVDLLHADAMFTGDGAAHLDT